MKKILWMIICLFLIQNTYGLIVNEVMYNPKGTDQDFEYVELYNPDNELINLDELWMIGDDKEHKRIQDYSAWNTETNATYLIITSCYSTFYETIDNDILFNPISFDEVDDWGDPVCDTIGNNLKNSKDYVEIWYCPTSWEEQDCTLVDDFIYNSSMGGRNNGKSLQLINGNWEEAKPTPGRENEFEKIETEGSVLINIEETVFKDIDYTSIFKIKLKNKDCRKKDNVLVFYNISDEFGDTENNISVEVGCTKSFGSWEFDSVGDYTVCVVVPDFEAKDCFDLQVVDSNTIDCDVNLSLNFTSENVVYPMSIQFKPILSNNSYPFKIEYWFENSSQVLRKKVETLNTNKKSYKPKAYDRNNSVVVWARLSSIACNDDLSDNIVSYPITYGCNPGVDDFKVKTCLNGKCKDTKGFAKFAYSKLFSFENLGYSPCSRNDSNISFYYNITLDGDIIENGSSFISFKKTKKTIGWTPDVGGNYTICGDIINSDANVSNNIDCKTIEIIDTSKEPCNVFLNLTLEKDLFQNGESIKYKILLNDNSFPYTISYWVNDLFGEEVKGIKNTTNPGSKSFTERITEKERVFVLRTNLSFLYCNDSNLSDNFAEKYVVVNGTQINTGELASISIEKIYLGTDNKTEWGELFKVKTRIYKNNTGKTSVSAYVVNSGGTKVSEQTSKINLQSKDTLYDLTIPVGLKPNCNAKYSGGTYTLVIEGLGVNHSKDFTIQGDSDLCESSDDCESSSENNGEFKYYIENSPSIATAGNDFSVKLKINNGEENDKEVTAYAYVYKGSKSFSGERERNKQTVIVSENSDLSLGLNVVLDSDMDAGEYKVKVRIKWGDRKTYKELTRIVNVIVDKVSWDASIVDDKIVVEVNGAEKYEVEMKSFLQEQSKKISGNTKVYFEPKIFDGENVFFMILRKNDKIVEIKKLVMDNGRKLVQTQSVTSGLAGYEQGLSSTKEPVTVYKSTSKKAQEKVPIFLIGSLCLLCTVLIIKAKNL